ncbi:hypothetical protein MJG53_020700, partial [Ovis ammon polii x Ovis aries]
MLLAVVLASALFLCSSASQGCFTYVGIKNIVYLIDNLQGNCSTACFQEGLSQLSNSTVSTRFRLTLNQVKRIVVALKSNKCGSFACEQPCNRTTTGNTVTFLKTLLESFQNENMRG